MLHHWVRKDVPITDFYRGIAGSQRRKYFSEDYMRTFNNLHGTSVGGEAPKGGYPDMGNGRYAANWRYDEWFTFNNWQRAHYNFIEQLTPTIVWILIGCAYKPLASAILGFLYFLGRVVFTVGYS